MIQVEVKSTLNALTARLDLLPKERMAAAVRALNRTITTVRAESARALQKDYPGLKSAALKKRLRFTKATRTSLVARLTFRSGRFSIFHNWPGVRQTNAGVRLSRMPWAIETWDGTRVSPEVLRRAFIRRPAGNRGQENVYIRVGNVPRYPIQGLVAPSVASAFAERRIGEQMARLARTRFAVVFQQEAKFRLSKRA